MKSLIFSVCIMISGAVYAATPAPLQCSSTEATITLQGLEWIDSGDYCPAGYRNVEYYDYNTKILGLQPDTEYSDDAGNFTMGIFCPLTE